MLSNLPTVALCAIAKNENNYLREWVEHHLKFNFNKIYLIDNNDLDGEHFEEVIDDYIKNDQVRVINKRGIKNAQIKSYDEFYQGIANQYDWVCFWDIDEFLFLDWEKTIQEFITSPRFVRSNCNTIVINWKYYDDNNLVCVQDNNYSVLNRFTNPAKYTGIENWYGKRIVKTKIKNLHINSSHGPIDLADIGEVANDQIINNEGIIAVNAAGKVVTRNGCSISCPTHTSAHLRHYRFKTIEEYVTNKMKRGYATLWKNSGQDLSTDEFFAANEVTDEKIAWLKENVQLTDKNIDIINTICRLRGSNKKY